MKDEPIVITKLSEKHFPPQLFESPEPPKDLYVRGSLPNSDIKLLTIVGSRRCTSYGKQAVEKIVSELAGAPISIVSGLALGIDAIAHRAALTVGLHTIAVPGSGISDEVLYPRTNVGLAHDIVASGGALLSEYEPDFKAAQWSFPKRNRIMAALSHAVLVVEAEARSGTLITARLALDYNKELVAIPGSIFSNTSHGTNQLLKQGAAPIQSGQDILDILNIDMSDNPIQQTLSFDDCSPDEMSILDALIQPLNRTELATNTKLDAQTLATKLTVLEIKGYITEQGGKIYRKS